MKFFPKNIQNGAISLIRYSYEELKKGRTNFTRFLNWQQFLPDFKRGLYWNTCNYRVRELFLQVCFFELLLFDTGWLTSETFWKLLMSQLNPPADVLRSCVWHVTAVMWLIERQPEASGCDVPPPQSNELTSKHQQRPVCGSSCCAEDHAHSNKKTSEVHDMTCLVELLLEEQSDFREHTFAAPSYRSGKCLPGSTVTEM